MQCSKSRNIRHRPPPPSVPYRIVSSMVFWCLGVHKKNPRKARVSSVHIFRYGCTYDTYITNHYHTIHCHTIHCHTRHYYTLQYCTLPYNTLAYTAVPYNTLPYDTLPYNTLSMHYHTTNYHSIYDHTIHYNALHYICIHIYIYVDLCVYISIYIFITLHRFLGGAVVGNFWVYSARTCLFSLLQDHVMVTAHVASSRIQQRNHIDPTHMAWLSGMVPYPGHTVSIIM